MTLNVIYHDSLTNRDVTINSSINTSDENHIIVVHEFVITGDIKDTITITHHYKNLFDFISNPKKKYDFFLNTKLTTKHNNTIKNKYLLHCEEDEELKEKLTQSDVSYSDSIYILYAEINNSLIVKAQDLTLKNIPQRSSVKIVDAHSEDVTLSIKVYSGSTHETLYIGTANQDFTWIATSPHELLHVLLNAIKLSTHAYPIVIPYDKIAYQIQHAPLITQTWTQQDYANVSETIKNPITQELEEIITNITVSSTHTAWQAEIKTGRKIESQKLGHMFSTVYSTSVYEPTKKQLLHTLNENEQLLAVLVKNYSMYQDRIKKCANQLQLELEGVS